MESETLDMFPDEASVDVDDGPGWLGTVDPAWQQELNDHFHPSKKSFARTKMKEPSKRRFMRVQVFERELVVSNRHPGRALRRNMKKQGLGSAPGDEGGPETEEPPKRSSGDINKFSSKSRRRLFRLFNRIQIQLIGTPVFITLTARPGLLEGGDFQKKFQQRFKAFLRKKIPGALAVWRLEPHRSGKPHYHLMLWSTGKGIDLTSEYWKRMIRKEWRACIGDWSRSAELYSCKIKDVDDVDQMFRYLSKYLAKEDDAVSAGIRGRRWGCLGDVPVSPITEFYLSSDDAEGLFNLARAFLKAAGKEELLERMEEFHRNGWSLWLPLEKSAEFIDFLYVGFASSDIAMYESPP